MKKTLLITMLALLGMSQAVAEESDYLPIAREGVKWVNEKIIINHGDTTRYYYTYEFSGKDSTGSNYMSSHVDNACYYYTGKNLNVEQDSLIAGISDNYPYPFEVSFFRNHAYDAVKEEGRNLIELPMYADGGTRTLYYFKKYYYPESGTIDFIDYIIDFFLWLQEVSDSEIFLTRENFIKIDPLIIEDIECCRYVYLSEEGQPLAYLVEGIGFDSYDLGDLLTPFTRKPDPDADYQEWCGLSHVIKNGEIIYKGMRYREGAADGIDEVVADKTRRPLDPNYYNLMGQPVGKDVPTTPGIYIHQGKKIVVR
ncbi:MAG: hypothetical protein IKX56_03520 [Muribaculaceae bacterium]|nr:hypothetical protein [Muribaculaceae bacterium]